MTDVTDDPRHSRDLDPEDAYDPGDDIRHRLTLLARIVQSIRLERALDRERSERRKLGALALVERIQVELDNVDDELADIRRLLEAV